MQQFLNATDVVDWHNQSVGKIARDLAKGLAQPVEIARRCFEWVRDEIRHSGDYQLNPVTCTASEVLEHRTGICFAKSHFLAALLRANQIPTGFCYQRLSVNGDGPPFSLHGFNAVYLPIHSWYRIDARGNREGIDAHFNPPTEKLAFQPNLDGELTVDEIYASPLPVVVDALRKHKTLIELWRGLPDCSF
jgi:transglutaminase-like putative cysteine protease